MTLQMNWRRGQGGSVRWRSPQTQVRVEHLLMIPDLAQLLLWLSVQAQSDLRQLTSDTVLTILTSLEASLNRAWATESASRGLVGVAVAGGGLQENISCLLDDGKRGAGRWV